MIAMLCCHDCGKREVLAVSPGMTGEDTDLFRLTRPIPMIGWCEACWLRRFGKPTFPCGESQPKPKR